MALTPEHESMKRPEFNFQGAYLPRVLIIDDQWGATVVGRPNSLRRSFCGTHGLVDATGDDKSKAAALKIEEPIAEAVFCRGQSPACARIGDTVENDLAGALKVVSEGWNCDPKRRWAAVFIDMEFLTGPVTADSDPKKMGTPEGRPSDQSSENYFGLRLVEAIAKEFPDLPIIVLSSKDKKPIVEKYSRNAEFISKDESKAEFASFIWTHGLVPDDRSQIIGFDLELLKALRSARKAASTRATVLIRGESGTGKEPLAQYLMQWSAHFTNGQERTSLNCGALSENLYYSTLFGHVKGSYTDAKTDRVGLFQLASGGDLFLDEIANLPPSIQMGVLRAIQEKQIAKLGDENTPIDVDVRLIAATNENLEQMVEEKRFRGDLFARLKVIELRLPPLRERMGDLEDLVTHFVRKYERETSAATRVVSAEAMDRIKSYDWPMNIRELSNAIQASVVLNPHREFMWANSLPISVPDSATDIEEQADQPFEDGGTSDEPIVADQDPIIQKKTSAGPSGNLVSLIEAMNRMEFVDSSKGDLEAHWPELKLAFKRLATLYLDAAFELTSTSAGKPVPKRATELIMGQADIAGNVANKIFMEIASTEDDYLLSDQRVLDLLFGNTMVAAQNETYVSGSRRKSTYDDRATAIIERLSSAKGVLRKELEQYPFIFALMLRYENDSNLTPKGWVAKKFVEQVGGLPGELKTMIAEGDPEVSELLR